MNEDELNAIETWLRRYQNVELPQTEIADPAAAAARLGDLAQSLISDLRTEAEPSAFARLLHDLAPENLRKGSADE